MRIYASALREVGVPTNGEARVVFDVYEPPPIRANGKQGTNVEQLGTKHLAPFEQAQVETNPCVDGLARQLAVERAA